MLFRSKKEFFGKLERFDGENLVLSDGENSVTFSKADIASVKLDDYDF